MPRNLNGPATLTALLLADLDSVVPVYTQRSSDVAKSQLAVDAFTSTSYQSDGLHTRACQCANRSAPHLPFVKHRRGEHDELESDAHSRAQPELQGARIQSPTHGSNLNFVRREGELEQAQKKIAELESQLAASQNDLGVPSVPPLAAYVDVPVMSGIEAMSKVPSTLMEACPGARPLAMPEEHARP
ncbi:hypothetical protein NUW54_g1829 [Trametes sanguinea]|uniref:Uncharacterized protein n=1 Tax=Trametes sanguinea TaxID=158606 RepID=A0ACC1Q5V1_9APHY|nr:hypothetical protein NUW54_g1829 [Trametes sanguinea]